jgi:aconitate hydratase
MPLLLKAKGKTTTDQISPAGKWLRFRGHLDAISDNTFSGVTNAFTGERGLTIDLTTGERGKPMAEPRSSRDRPGMNRGVRGESRQPPAQGSRIVGIVPVRPGGEPSPA